MTSRKKTRSQWYRVDLHVHTPASADYIDAQISYLDILKKAEQRGVDIIAFTDHNTVAGYAAMQREVEQLNYLERLGRAQPEELRRLAEYRRLLDKILVLPGFEFTATFGFHVLGLFSPHLPVRQIEYLLLHLNIPAGVLDNGNSEVGASSDVLTAYRVITEAGGICIAAHANSAHGVAMIGMEFGGQTRMAYTQDRHLHALEVTDLGRRDRRSTQRFFDGTKPEYPRRMRCIQGSDAHSLNTVRDKTGRVITLGVGERITEVLLADRSFEALVEMFQSGDFSRSRAYTPNTQPEDYIQLARAEGPSLIQSFHESMERKGGKLGAIITDVCAFANTNGGTIYIGISADKKKKPVGVVNPKEAVEILQREISQTIAPALNPDIDIQETQGKSVIRIQVPFGQHRPYAIDNNKIYVRDEADTTMAVRDEIVNLVRQGLGLRETAPAELPPPPEAPKVPSKGSDEQTAPTEAQSTELKPPRAGVEIISVEKRDGLQYYTMHDLRNGNMVKNVTLNSARRLWHYAIKQAETNPVKLEQVQWNGDIGLWRKYKKGGEIRYDLVQRTADGVRVYYGVTDNGMFDHWHQFLDPEDAQT